jgi:hypothetical protein
MTALARPISNLQTHPLVREDAPNKETHICQTENKNVVMRSRWEPDNKTIGRNSVSTSISTFQRPVWRLARIPPPCESEEGTEREFHVQGYN